MCCHPLNPMNYNFKINSEKQKFLTNSNGIMSKQNASFLRLLLSNLIFVH